MKSHSFRLNSNTSNVYYLLYQVLQGSYFNVDAIFKQVTHEAIFVLIAYYFE